jgi:hypothetical protein
MKKIVQVTEVDGEGLVGHLTDPPTRLTFYCMNYIYTGDLVGVNDSEIKLDNAAIVYETGPFTEKAWKDAQALPGPWYVRLAAVESWGVLK